MSSAQCSTSLLSSLSHQVRLLSIKLRAVFGMLVLTLLLGVSFSDVSADEPDASQAALVIKAPQINGRVEGSIQMLEGRSVNFNSGAEVIGDFFVPGSPQVNINGQPDFAGVVAGAGNTSPTNYSVMMNSGVTLGRLVTQTDPVVLPSVAQPTSTSGNRWVSLNQGQSAGDWTTLRSLSLNSNYGNIDVPAGSYDRFTLNSNTSMTFGVAGSTEPTVYDFTQITLNTDSQIILVGPVILNIKSGFTVNNRAVLGLSPDGETYDLNINVYSSDVHINSGALVNAQVLAPNSRVNISGTLCGWVGSKYLTVNSNGLLKVSGNGQTGGGNQAPVADSLSLTVNEDDTLPLTLTASDADNDALTYTLLTQPSNGTLTGTAPNLNYTPSPDFNGTVSFTYLVNDGTADSEIATVSITVIPVNDPPVADALSIETPEDTEATITLSGSDIDSDILSYSIITQPANGTITGAIPDLTYTPAENFNGTDSFTYLVNDGSADSVIATVSITVTPVNDQPLADSASIETNEDEQVAITLTGSDLDNDDLSYTLVTPPNNGVITGDTPNLVYTPNANFNGSDTFTFKTNDGTIDSEVATISINVLPINDAPTAESQTVTTPEDTALAITLNGTDLDNDTLTYTIVTQPANGTLTGTAPDLTYTPTENFNGSDSFIYLVNDGTVDSAIAPINITVSPVNDPPVIVVTYPEDSQVFTNVDSVPIKAKASDIDGAVSEVIFYVDSVEVGRSNSQPYDINWQHDEAGIYTIQAKAVDSDGAIGVSELITIEVEISNRPPVVDAGIDQDIETAATGIHGIVTDDGLPIDGNLSLEWQQVSGPGIASFDDASSQSTIARFDTEGSYILKLLANDGELEATDLIEINYISPDSRNQPPSVDAGVDQNVNFQLSRSENLILNPGAELLDTSGELQSWVNTKEIPWLQDNTYSAHTGDYYFYAGSSTEAELIQVIDVSSYNEEIQNGIKVFEFNGYVKLKDETRIDSSYVILEFLDDSGVLLAHENIPQSPYANEWLRISSQFIPPVNTSAIKVIIGSINNLNDQYNDAFFDSLSLYALDTSVIDLKGAVSDDLLPEDSVLTSQWNMSSGPASVEFIDKRSPETEVIIFSPGVYTFELEGSDGSLSASDTVVVSTLGFDGQRPPSVDAGEDLIVSNAFEFINLNGVVSDPDTPIEDLEIVWSVVTGLGKVSITDPTDLQTSITFGESGEYKLQIMASDGVFSVFDTVDVTVNCNQNPLDIAIVMDVSGSMAGDNIANAISASANFVSGLYNSSDRVAVVPFSSSASIEQSLGFDLDAAVQSIEGLQASGGTSISAGISVAAEELLGNGRSEAESVIILLSDGQSDALSASIAARAAKESGVRIMTIGLGLSAAHDVLIDAASHPSQYFFVQGAEDVNGVYESLSRGLCRTDTDVLNVYAGSNQLVASEVSVSLRGRTDSSGMRQEHRIIEEWSVELGDGEVIFSDSSAAYSEVLFRDSGIYVLKLVSTAISELGDVIVTASDYVTINVETACSLPAPEGMIAWWRSNGRLVEEVTGRESTKIGGLDEGPQYIDDYSVLGWEFDGADDGVLYNISEEQSLDAASGVTIEFWARFDQDRSATLFQWPSEEGGVGLSIVKSSSSERIYINFEDEQGATVSNNLIYAYRDLIGEWAHWAVTLDDQNKILHLYRNGRPVLIESFTQDINFKLSDNLYIGCSSSEDNSFDGALDELAIYRRSLTRQEVWEIYQAGEHGKCEISNNQAPIVDAGQRIYLNNASESVSLEGFVSDDGLPENLSLGYHWELVAGPDGSVINDPVALVTAVDFVNEGHYLFQLTVSDGGAVASDTVIVSIGEYCNTPAPEGMIAWWKADGSFFEEVGKTLALPYYSLGFTEGENRFAWEFDSADQVISHTLSDQQNLSGATGVTVEFWARMDLDRSSTIFHWPSEGEGSGLQITKSSSSERIYWLVEDVSGITRSHSIINGYASLIGQWAHWAFSYDEISKLVRIFRNGELVIEQSMSESANLNLSDTLWIGNNSTLTSGYDGGIDELSIYDRSLNGGEIWQIYAAGEHGKCDLGGNQMPLVDAGPTLYIENTGEEGVLSGVVSDDGLPLGTGLSYYWEVITGPGDVNIENAESLETAVQFSELGAYLMQLSVSDGAAQTNDTVTVNVGSSCSLTAPEGLIAWWKADANVIEEVSGSNSSIYNGLNYIAERNLLTWDFNGVNNTVGYDVLESQKLDNASGVTVEFWARMDLDRSSTIFHWPSQGEGSGLRITKSSSSERIYWLVEDVSGITSSHSIINGYTSLIGQWAHWAFSYDENSKLVRIFRNGELLIEQSMSESANLNLSDTLWIGNNSSLTAAYDGGIDDLSIYDRALDINEIWSIYQAGEKGKCDLDGNNKPLVDAGHSVLVPNVTDVAVLSGNVSDDGFPQDIGLSYSWEIVKGPEGAVIANPTLLETLMTFTNEGQYLCKLTANDGASTASDTVVVYVGDCSLAAPEGLVAWWKANNNAVEELTGQNSLVYNNLNYNDERSLYAWDFDGINDRISYQSSLNQKLAEADGVTVEFWARMDLDRSATMFHWPSQGEGSGLRITKSSSSERIYWLVEDVSGITRSHYIDDGYTSQIGQWAHWAFSYDEISKLVRIFRNGELVIEQSMSESANLNLSEELWIGNNSSLTSAYDGGLDELSVYNRALSSTEIQAIYDAGDCNKVLNFTPNSAPTISAGIDRMITLDDTFTTEASLIDDDLPLGESVVIQWMQVSGLESAIIVNAENLNTEIIFTEAGEYVFEVSANDSEFIVTDRVTVDVTTAPNQRPVVYAGDDMVGYTGETLYLNGVVLDDGLPIGGVVSSAWSVVSGPSSVQFDDVTSINTSLSVMFPGEYTLRLTASDGELTHQDDVVLTIEPEIVVPPVNEPPVVNAGVDQNISFGENIVILGEYTDDGLPQNTVSTQWYKLSGPGNVSFRREGAENLVSFSAAGVYILRYEVSDGDLIGSDDLVVSVLPSESEAPIVSILSPVSGNQFSPNQDVEIYIGAHDLDGFIQRVELYANNNQLTQITEGSLFYSWQKPALGNYELKAIAYDNSGTSSISEIVNITVGYSNPSIININPINHSEFVVQSEIYYEVEATDDDGLVTYVEFFRDGVSLGRDDTAPYEIKINSDDVGTFSLSATAFDDDGLSRNSEIVNVTFYEEGNPPLPQLFSDFELPDVVDSKQDIIGSAYGTIFTDYTLSYRADGDNAWTEFANSSSPVVEDSLAVFDPSLLENGIYEILLQVYGDGGAIQSVIRDCLIDSELKIGHFTLAFEDLTVPLSGVPITVTRAYDSRDQSIGDFGQGWELGLQSMEVSTIGVVGLNWSQQRLAGLILLGTSYQLSPANNSKVIVKLPGGDVETFKPTVEGGGSQQFIPITYGNLAFEAEDDAEGSLAVLGDSTFAYNTAGSPYDSVSFGNLVDPFTAEPFNPTRFLYTDKAGNEYQISIADGLFGLKDTNDNTLTFDDNGIYHSSGESVLYTRNSDGLIETITDPSGNELHYRYNGTQLVEFENRVGEITQFFYENANFPNYLTRIVDPAGNDAIRSEYDSDGRLISQTDADGNTIEFEHDIANNREIIRDRLGNATIHEYNDQGYVTQTTDALGGITSYEYDEYGNETSVTTPEGVTTIRDYDRIGNVLSEQDGLGNTTSYDYNSRSNPTTITDALGRTTSMDYYGNGNLSSMTDSAGTTTSFGYSASGNLSSLTDASGTVTSYTHDGKGRELSMTVRDSAGSTLRGETYEYDTNGNRTKSTTTRTSSDGTVETLITTYVYDEENRLLETTLPDGTTSSTEYNSIGKQSKTTDALGREMTYAYDNRGNLILTTYPDGTTSSSAYDVEGRMTASTDQLGITTYYVYDALGRQTQTILPDDTMPAAVLSEVEDILAATELDDNPSTTTEYDGDGRVTASIDPLGNRTEYEYDGASRRVLVRDALGNVTQTSYDEAGQQTSVTDALSRTTSFQYDTAGRLLQTVFPDTTTTQVAYDTLGRRSSVTDQEGNVTSYEYDDLGRMTAVIDAESYRTEYVYNEQGSLLIQRDALGRETKFGYDTLGRRTTRTLPEGQVENVTYNVLGNMLTRQDFNGHTTSYAYDVMNRLTSITADSTHPSLSLGIQNAPAKFEYGYDNLGRRTSAVVKDSSDSDLYADSWSYDVRGQLTQHGSTHGNLDYGYDAAGNLLSSQSDMPDGYSQTYAYDTLNRLEDLYHGQDTATRQHIAAYSYDAVGNLSGTGYLNQITHDYSYNTLNRLTNLQIGKQSGATSNPVHSYTYTLNAAGHRTQVTESTGRTLSYVYDKLYRLKSETIAGTTANNGLISYTHDNVGNRLARSSSVLSVPSVVQSYSNNDLLTDNGYDDNGNTLTSADLAIGSGNTADVYDFRNKLIKRSRADGSVVTLSYNADGDRVRKTVSTASHSELYLIDRNNHTGYAQVVEKMDESGVLTERYHFGHDLVALDTYAGITATEERSYYHYDGHGSVRALSNENGVVQEEYDYDAFGILIDFRKLNNISGVMETLPTNDLALHTHNRYLYAGEQWDTDLGMYYNRARYLNTQTGRFHSMDTYEGRNGEPMTLHKYLYTHGNPVSNIDPSGKFSVLSAIAPTVFLSAMSSVNAFEFRLKTSIGLTIIKLIYIHRYIVPLIRELRNSAGQFQSRGMVNYAILANEALNQMITVYQTALASTVIGTVANQFGAIAGGGLALAAASKIYEGVELAFEFSNMLTENVFYFYPDYIKGIKSVAVGKSNPDQVVYWATELTLSGGPLKPSNQFMLDEIKAEYDKHGEAIYIGPTKF